MIDNQQFIAATDFLKYKKKVKIGEIAERIGINRGRMDNLRRNGVPMDLKEAKELVKQYPEVLKFFTENITEKAAEYELHDSQEQAGYGEVGVLRETLAVQKELIAMQRLRIAQLEMENEKLKDSKR